LTLFPYTTLFRSLVEVTPNAIRLRKRHLDPHERKRMAKVDG
jgi:GTP-binding protein